jgi:hypothetical protein
MSKNREGFTKSGGPIEWGSKARKEEARLRGSNNQARREAVEEGLAETHPRRCVGCFRDMPEHPMPEDHAYGCPTGQNGPPNYN